MFSSKAGGLPAHIRIALKGLAYWHHREWQTKKFRNIWPGRLPWQVRNIRDEGGLHGDELI